MPLGFGEGCWRREKPYSFLPYVFAAIFVTVGLIFYSKLTIFGILSGAVWLPMLFVFPGILIGFILKKS